jgi:hypothetical protein
MASVQTSKPLDNLTYDIVSILHEKSQALEAYDDYMQDAQGNAEIARLFEDIRRHDEEDIQRLRFELGRLLGTASEASTAPPGADEGSAL